jgi:hypothetical protein
VPEDGMSLLRRLRWGAALLAVALCAWAALAPLRFPTRELPLAFARGGAVPGELTLTLGVRDVLLLRNDDRVAHVFGQLRVLPGRELRLPFETAGSFVFACDAAPGAQVTVRVEPHPDPGWARLRWRAHAFADALRTLPLQGPED